MAQQDRTYSIESCQFCSERANSTQTDVYCGQNFQHGLFMFDTMDH